MTLTYLPRLTCLAAAAALSIAVAEPALAGEKKLVEGEVLHLQVEPNWRDKTLRSPVVVSEVTVCDLRIHNPPPALGGSCKGYSQTNICAYINPECDAVTVRCTESDGPGLWFSIRCNPPADAQ